MLVLPNTKNLDYCPTKSHNFFFCDSFCDSFFFSHNFHEFMDFTHKTCHCTEPHLGIDKGSWEIFLKKILPLDFPRQKCVLPDFFSLFCVPSPTKIQFVFP